ncbi:histidine kinase [Paraflavisolibacter sp. H34]|uniref:sensor histidine kinase n=1 Tax=Huijunlia imazamoxiresistens TaxID=3127457 RepID=UPI00301752A6
MFLLQAANNANPQMYTVLFLGTLGMLVLTVGLVLFIIFHQRRVIRYQLRLQQIEQEQQKILLQASIESQEEERQRIAADLHDDAGPLLATARLYLNENLVQQDKDTQRESIALTREIIDEAIQLIRGISHSLMPPTLKNFGLESAVNDIFHKLNGSGSLEAYSQFYDYSERLNTEKEMNIFRVIQELVNNILKHSHPAYIHLTQNRKGNTFVLWLEHDGQGLVQSDFERLNKSKSGLGLKNISSRMKVARGTIFFEKDPSQDNFKVTIEVPGDEISENEQ